MTVFDQFSMDTEVAVVTGAAGGLGCELARILAAANATVILVDINEQAFASLAEELTQLGYNALTHACDVTDPVLAYCSQFFRR
ncbi:MAG: SDR family NAD(P)-dependent oxidoreductase [Rubripirellula sp.]|nr:SDR family NAD(P)-dependent oxidoreductase [Rubripirellula sp.]